MNTQVWPSGESLKKWVEVGQLFTMVYGFANVI